MREIPFGFSLVESDEGLILRNKRDDGTVTQIEMAEEQVYALKAAIFLWMDRKMSGFQVASGSVKPIVAHAVARVRLLPDAVQEIVLLTVEAPSGEQMTLSFPLTVADHIAAELPDPMAEMRTRSATKQ